MPLVKCPICQVTLDDGELTRGACPYCQTGLSSARPDTVIGGIDMRVLARRQRLLLWCVLASILNPLLPIFLPSLVGASGDAVLVLMLANALVSLACWILMIVGVVGVMAALRRPLIMRILWALFMFVPLVSLYLLVRINNKATRTLRQVGLRVGFMGVSDEAVLRQLSLNRCRKCGYDLTGNVSGRCSECGAEVHGAVPAMSSS